MERIILHKVVYNIDTYTMYIAIPTYKRSSIIEKKTLQTLLHGGIEPSSIFLFVANKKEADEYSTIVPRNMYNKIVIGKLGIAQQRIFINHYFNTGVHVVSIDDDVEGVYKLNGSKLVQIHNLTQFFKEAFNVLKKENKYIWGIYPVRNPFFMKPTTTTNTLTFIIGALHGYIVRHDKSLEPSSKSEGKEDFEQSILYYLNDGGVVRFNSVTIKTKFLAKGGLGEHRFERNKKSAKYLQKKYPDFVRIVHRKNGMTEVRLNKTRKIRP